MHGKAISIWLVLASAIIGLLGLTGNTNAWPVPHLEPLPPGHVFYNRTHDHSSMAVGSNSQVSTHFDVPATQESGARRLEVIANGIPSASVAVWVN